MDEGNGDDHSLLERLRQEEGSVDGSEVAWQPPDLAFYPAARRPRPRGDLQVGRTLEHDDRDGGSLAEADGQRNRASVELGVCPREVVDALKGREASESAVGAEAIVEVERWSEGVETL